MTSRSSTWSRFTRTSKRPRMTSAPWQMAPWLYPAFPSIACRATRWRPMTTRRTRRERLGTALCRWLPLVRPKGLP
eukprot:g32636.t1